MTTRLNIPLRSVVACLLIGLSVIVAASILHFEFVRPPKVNLAQNQMNVTSREFVMLRVTVLDSTERLVAWAEVNVTYSCDYITQEGSLALIQSSNGTNSVTLDCGIGYSPHELFLHVTVTALGFNESSFTDTVIFYGNGKELDYVVHLTHLPFTQSSITLENFSLCVDTRSKLTNLEGTVYVHGNMPVVGLRLFINGTDLGSYPPPIVMTTTVPNGGVLSYGIMFGVQLTSSARISVMPGDGYRITLTAVFYDGSTSTASASVVAQSGYCPYLGMG